MARRTVAVLGGGCAGTLVAIRLLRCTDDEVVLVEPGTPGGGLAYGAARPWHLLNARASAMSAHPDEPGHFTAWSGGDRDAFLPRLRYGRYLAAVLDATAAAHPGRLRVMRGRAAAVHADDTGVAVRLADGRGLRTAHAVLAVGNPRSAPPWAGLLADPWRTDPAALDGPVLLLGTGLTAVDAALTLGAHGRGGPIDAVSRRGVLPGAHGTPVASLVPPTAPDAGRGLGALLRAVRAACAEADDWRTVVDGLRPHLDRLWAGLGPDGQDRFLRHAARHWEAYRHRMAPAVAADIARLRAAGQLRVHAGGLSGLVAQRRGVTATFADGTTRWYAAALDCTGPGRLPHAAPPLVQGLLAAGAAVVGPHGLGLDADADGRLVRADGTVHRRLWLVGPLRRGRLWETTAVPEIRAQVARLATVLAPQARLAQVA
jgi:uncharacterized NAD(P)/FAD-binding protein YdhS